MAKQLNVFLENKPGRLAAVLGVLAKSEISVRAITIQDRGDFGIVRCLADMPEKAQILLSEGGFACALKDVLAVVVDDRPGGLQSLAAALQAHGINVLDGYGFVVESSRLAVFCLEVDFPRRIQDILAKEGFRILEDQELYTL